MICDLRRLPVGSEVHGDLCIVGGGAAGVSIARQLIGSGLDICLVESGGFDFEADTQALYAGTSIGHWMELDVGRYRQLGGSTNRWTGRCAWLDPIDFERRDWIEFSGWPIDRDTLAPFYLRAETLCGFRQSWCPGDPPGPAPGHDHTPVGSAALDPFVWRYAPQPDGSFMNWGQQYREELRASAQVQMLLHANVVGFACAGDGQTLQSIDVASLSGERATVTARAFVLCCGGIENARLLLQSANTVPGGLGNAHDQVGRYFMQHPRGRTAEWTPTQEQAERVQTLFNIFPHVSGVQHEFGVALSAATQRAEGLLNCSGIVTVDEDQQRGWGRLKAALSDAQRHDFVSAAQGIVQAWRDPASIFANIERRARRSGPPLLRAAQAALLVDLEQVPDAGSRVTLSDELDALGQHKARVDWRLSELERTTARCFTDLAAAEFRRLGLGDITPMPWLEASGPITPEELSGTYHHIATTRMSEDPRQGVVDAQCRVHGTENLYVAGCSVFATGGHANPTLTIVALALRLADHLKETLLHAATARQLTATSASRSPAANAL